MRAKLGYLRTKVLFPRKWGNIKKEDSIVCKWERLRGRAGIVQSVEGLRYGLDNPVFDSRERQEIFSFFQRAADVKNANLR